MRKSFLAVSLFFILVLAGFSQTHVYPSTDSNAVITGNWSFTSPTSIVELTGSLAPLNVAPACTVGQYWLAPITGSVNTWQFCSNGVLLNLAGGGSAIWGSITGTLSGQTDLQAALNAKQGSLSLTTTGSSGASTLIGNTLNIPQYSGSGVMSVTASLPVVSSGGTTPNITFTWPSAIPGGTTIPYSQVTSQPSIPTSANWPNAGTCTNQAVTALTNGAGPTCTTLTSAYVNNSIALTGSDINTSNNVTATHLASPLPIIQGGSGTTTPGLVAGSGISITGSWPDQTITSTSGGGSVTVFSAGNLSPLFTTTVATATTTPALSFTLSNASSNTVYGNFTGSSALPSFNAVPSCSTSTSALNYVLGTGLSCNTSITASSVPFSGVTGSPSFSQVPFQSLTTSGSGAATLASGVLNVPTPSIPLTVIQVNGSPLTPSAGADNLVAGSNITLTPSGNQVTITASSSASTQFSALTTSTNTAAAMTVGSGASLNTSGSGTIAATSSISLANNALTQVDVSQTAGTGAGLGFPGTGLTVGSVYYVSGAGSPLTLTLAKADASSTSNGICIAVSTTVCLNNGTFVFSSSQSWTAGGPVYLSDSTAGTLTQTAPTTLGHFVVPIGIASDVGTLIMNVGIPKAAPGYVPASVTTTLSVGAGSTVPVTVNSGDHGSITIFAINGTSQEQWSAPFITSSSTVTLAYTEDNPPSSLFTVACASLTCTATNINAGTNYTIAVRSQ